MQLNSCISALGYLAEDWPKVCKGKTSGVGATFECDFQAETSRGLVHVPNVSMRFSSADTKFVSSDTGVLRRPGIQYVDMDIETWLEEFGRGAMTVTVTVGQRCQSVVRDYLTYKATTARRLGISVPELEARIREQLRVQ